MRTRLPLSFLMMLLVLASRGQITIETGDMPQPGDTLRLSISTTLPAGYHAGGPGQTWDMSGLQSVNQRLDTFVSILQVPPEFWVTYVPNIVSNLASPQNGNIVFPGLPISDSYEFFKNDATGFTDLGYGFRLMGFPMTMKYDSPDLWYPLPLNMGQMWNSDSQASLAIPMMAYIGSSITRNSYVDGWGTLITPYGTFETLRVKSEVIRHDSINLDTLGVGFPINRLITEYKWLGKNQGVPLLQVNEEGGFATALYRDVYRQPPVPLSVSLGPDTAVIKGQTVTLTAVVTGGVPPYNYIWSTFQTGPSITVIVDTAMTVGVAVIDGTNNTGYGMVNLSLRWPPFIPEPGRQSLTITPNPASGRFSLQVPEGLHGFSLAMFNSAGDKVFEQAWSGSHKTVVVDPVPDLHGMYFIVLSSGDQRYTGKAILQ